MNYVVPYFFAGFCVFGLNFYLVLSNGLDKSVQERVGNVGSIQFWALSIFVNFLFWPLGVLTNAIIAIVPGAKEEVGKLIRRGLIDRPGLMEPQMPSGPMPKPPCMAMRKPSQDLGMLYANPTPPDMHSCGLDYGHDGLHQSFSYEFPENYSGGPPKRHLKAEWSQAETICAHSPSVICEREAGHEGKCRSSTGLEWEFHGKYDFPGGLTIDASFEPEEKLDATKH
jgi:hypothetical protein